MYHLQFNLADPLTDYNTDTDSPTLIRSSPESGAASTHIVGHQYRSSTGAVCIDRGGQAASSDPGPSAVHRSPLQSPSSTVDFCAPDDKRTITWRSTFPTSSFARELYEFRLNDTPRSTEHHHIQANTPDEEVVSSSTPDSRLGAIRHRSVSFCTRASSSDDHNNPRPSARNVSSGSILESILLNRNIPTFYSAVQSQPTSENRRSSHSKVQALNTSTFKRQRLHSLPLPSVVPPRIFETAHSNTMPTLARRDEDPEEPLCLTFKRRKTSLQDVTSRGSGCVSTNHSAEECDSRANSNFVRKMTSNGSILHSLLTCKDSSVDDDRKPVESMDFSESTPPDGSEVHNQNLPKTLSHADSTEALQTLEFLALADRSRHAGMRLQRVAIAKKMQLVVNRKVRKWLAEIAQLAAKYRDLTNLPREDWIVLLRSTVSRLLLLFMAENNFQFAVAPTSADKPMLPTGDAGDGSPAVVVPAEIPTTQSVEDIHRFIAKCQALKVDGKEYHCMRLITLFHAGCSIGLKRVTIIEQINSRACKILQDLIRISRPDDKLRYGELLLHLHSLASVNSRMVQKLFNIIPNGEEDGGSTHINESEWLM